MQIRDSSATMLQIPSKSKVCGSKQSCKHHAKWEILVLKCRESRRWEILVPTCGNSMQNQRFQESFWLQNVAATWEVPAPKPCKYHTKKELLAQHVAHKLQNERFCGSFFHNLKLWSMFFLIPWSFPQSGFCFRTYMNFITRWSSCCSCYPLCTNCPIVCYPWCTPSATWTALVTSRMRKLMISQVATVLTWMTSMTMTLALLKRRSSSYPWSAPETRWPKVAPWKISSVILQQFVGPFGIVWSCQNWWRKWFCPSIPLLRSSCEVRSYWGCIMVMTISSKV